MWDWLDTIVAPAAPPPQAGVAGLRSIVRWTGRDAHAVVARFCIDGPALDDPAWRRPFVRSVRWRLPAWNRVVAAELYAWPDKKSYTAQPTVELHLPAAAPLTAAVVAQTTDAVFGVPVARPARPGEFTLRAFLAGRLDLAQAEGVLGLIEADTVEQLRLAVDQRAGGLTAPIAAVRDDLLNLLADLEAGLDFVDDGVSFINDDEAAARMATAAHDLERIAARLGARAQAADALRLVLVGPANAGKSSLFNALVGERRALVAADPGTTRDYLAASLDLAGRTVELIDTAGFHGPADALDAAAGRLRDRLLPSADLLLVCTPLGADPFRDGPTTVDPARRFRLRTKVDQPAPPSADAVDVSLHRPETIDHLRAVLAERTAALDPTATGRAGSAALDRCRAGLAAARAALADAAALHRSAAGPEVVAVQLRETLDALGEIVGAVYTDDLLGRIFSRFCIGK
ncbi:MAG: GTPase [Planctomycetia bacterium]